jgi:hypothetical protein
MQGQDPAVKQVPEPAIGGSPPVTQPAEISTVVNNPTPVTSTGTTPPAVLTPAQAAVLQDQIAKLAVAAYGEGTTVQQGVSFHVIVGGLVRHSVLY